MVKKNKIEKKDRMAAVALAIIFGPFSWLYTYKYNAWKFWVGLSLSVFLCWTFIVPIAMWLWAIVDAFTDQKYLANISISISKKEE